MSQRPCEQAVFASTLQACLEGGEAIVAFEESEVWTGRGWIGRADNAYLHGLAWSLEQQFPGSVQLWERPIALSEKHHDPTDPPDITGVWHEGEMKAGMLVVGNARFSAAGQLSWREVLEDWEASANASAEEAVVLAWAGSARRVAPQSPAPEDRAWWSEHLAEVFEPVIAQARAQQLHERLPTSVGRARVRL